MERDGRGRGLGQESTDHFLVSPWPSSHFRSKTLRRRFPSGSRGLEVARESDRARVPNRPSGRLAGVGTGLHRGHLRRLDQRVEERCHSGAPLGAAPVVILPTNVSVGTSWGLGRFKRAQGGTKTTTSGPLERAPGARRRLRTWGSGVRIPPGVPVISITCEDPGSHEKGSRTRRPRWQPPTRPLHRCGRRDRLLPPQRSVRRAGAG